MREAATEFVTALRGIGLLAGGSVELLIVSVTSVDESGRALARDLLNLSGVPYLFLWKPWRNGHNEPAEKAVALYMNDFFMRLSRGCANYRTCFINSGLMANTQLAKSATHPAFFRSVATMVRAVFTQHTVFKHTMCFVCGLRAAWRDGQPVLILP